MWRVIEVAALLSMCILWSTVKTNFCLFFSHYSIISTVFWKGSGKEEKNTHRKVTSNCVLEFRRIVPSGPSIPTNQSFRAHEKTRPTHRHAPSPIVCILKNERMESGMEKELHAWGGEGRVRVFFRRPRPHPPPRSCSLFRHIPASCWLASLQHFTLLSQRHEASISRRNCDIRSKSKRVRWTIL